MTGKAFIESGYRTSMHDESAFGAGKAVALCEDPPNQKPRRGSGRRRESRATTRTNASGFPIPKLKAYLFGGLRVYIGNEKIADTNWRKAKSKVLFGHLITRFGREIGREVLTHAIWPDSDTCRATDNLYVLWSSLKKAITNQYGECPYVVCSGALYRVDSLLVESDVEEFEALSRKILFGDFSVPELSSAFIRIEQLYVGDLLEGIRCDDYLLGLRERYRDTYVDCLLKASQMHQEEGNFSEALWFARKSLGVDAKREDVYQTLMMAQGLAGQRTSAVETFLKCREYLDTELGLPLSKKTMGIYQRIITDTLEDGAKMAI